MSSQNSWVNCITDEQVIWFIENIFGMKSMILGSPIRHDYQEDVRLHTIEVHFNRKSLTDTDSDPSIIFSYDGIYFDNYWMPGYIYEVRPEAISRWIEYLISLKISPMITHNLYDNKEDLSELLEQIDTLEG